MDSFLYGLLLWLAMSAVTALMWLPVFLYQRAPVSSERHVNDVRAVIYRVINRFSNINRC